MQLFSLDPTIVLKFFKMFILATKSWENHPKELLRIPQINFFPLTALTAQMAQISWEVFAKKSADIFSYRISFITISRRNQRELDEWRSLMLLTLMTSWMNQWWPSL